MCSKPFFFLTDTDLNFSWWPIPFLNPFLSPSNLSLLNNTKTETTTTKKLFQQFLWSGGIPIVNLAYSQTPGICICPKANRHKNTVLSFSDSDLQNKTSKALGYIGRVTYLLPLSEREDSSFELLEHPYGYTALGLEED